MDIEKYKPYFRGQLCHYCGQPTELIDSAEIYEGVSYGWIYICKSCNAYVGCHTGSREALGMVANEELRLVKRRAHHYFDQLWKKKIFVSRYRAYSWLSKSLGIPRQYTHIGMSDIEQCHKIIDLAIDKMNRSCIKVDECPF